MEIAFEDEGMMMVNDHDGLLLKQNGFGFAACRVCIS